MAPSAPVYNGSRVARKALVIIIIVAAVVVSAGDGHKFKRNRSQHAMPRAAKSQA